MAENQQEFPTVIGPDASFKGEMTFDKGLRLQGKFEGKINSAGRLQIAREAKLNADVEAGSIIVEGEVRGNLIAADRVELKNTARYEGDLVAGKLVVEEGAAFNGHVNVGPESGKKGVQSAPAGLPKNQPANAGPQPQGQPNK